MSAALLMLAGAVGAYAQKPADKPRVPPGRDPGGVAIAIIGGGIDYTRPEVAQRLARDGEGEIVGWDFLDGDRRPLDGCRRAAPPSARCASRHADALLERAPDVRLVIARTSAALPHTLVQGMQFVAQTPARIVVIVFDGEPMTQAREFFDEAARRFPAQLLIAEANSDAAIEAAGNLVFTANPVDLAAQAAQILASNPSLDAPTLKRHLTGTQAPPRR